MDFDKPKDIILMAILLFCRDTSHLMRILQSSIEASGKDRRALNFTKSKANILIMVRFKISNKVIKINSNNQLVRVTTRTI